MLIICPLSFQPLRKKRYNCRDTRYEIFGEQNFDNKNNLKCYECDQLYFVHCLTEITNGKEYTQIKDFFKHLWAGRQKVKISETMDIVKKTNEDDKFKEGLRRIVFCTFQSDNELHEKFNQCIINYFWFSLSQFLTTTERNRERIKKCIQCNKIYIATTLKPQTFCSDKCRHDYHNKKMIQSGVAAKYKRDKRKMGAKESYY
jgi:hypothetical protein